MRTLLALAVVGAFGGLARAGDICTTQESAVRALENYARTNDQTYDPYLGVPELCIGKDPPDAKRIFKACTTILDRDPANEVCMVVVASNGKSMLGKHDIFAWVASRPLAPWSMNSSGPDYALYLFRDLGDPRALPLVVDMWKASIPKAAAWEKRKQGMPEWSRWRQSAAQVLGVVGGADELAFLDEQAKATKDTHVAQECRDAIKAITDRLAKAAPPPTPAPPPPASSAPPGG
jgi:hypothetical protein